MINTIRSIKNKTSNGIHSTIPAHAKCRAKGKDFRMRVYAALKHGKANAITSGKICLIIGEAPRGSNQRIRKACTELLEIDLLPIASCGHGFFIAETNEEKDECVNNIHARAEGLYRRESAWNKIEVEPKEYLFPME